MLQHQRFRELGVSENQPGQIGTVAEETGEESVPPFVVECPKKLDLPIPCAALAKDLDCGFGGCGLVDSHRPEAGAPDCGPQYAAVFRAENEILPGLCDRGSRSPQ